MLDVVDCRHAVTETATRVPTASVRLVAVNDRRVCLNISRHRRRTTVPRRDVIMGLSKQHCIIHRIHRSQDDTDGTSRQRLSAYIAYYPY